MENETLEPTEDRFVLLTRAANGMDAALLAAQLDEGDVPVQTVGGMAAIGFGDLPSDALLVEVWVPESRLEDGRRIFAEFERRRREGDESPKA